MAEKPGMIWAPACLLHFLLTLLLAVSGIYCPRLFLCLEYSSPSYFYTLLPDLVQVITSSVRPSLQTCPLT